MNKNEIVVSIVAREPIDSTQVSDAELTHISLFLSELLVDMLQYLDNQED